MSCAVSVVRLNSYEMHAQSARHIARHSVPETLNCPRSFWPGHPVLPVFVKPQGGGEGGKAGGDGGDSGGGDGGGGDSGGGDGGGEGGGGEGDGEGGGVGGGDGGGGEGGGRGGGGDGEKFWEQKMYVLYGPSVGYLYLFRLHFQELLSLPVGEYSKLRHCAMLAQRSAHPSMVATFSFEYCPTPRLPQPGMSPDLSE